MSAQNLSGMLDEIREAPGDSSQVTVEEILDAVGRRSFGPLLLLAGLVVLAPLIGDIPGVPTVTALFVLLIAGQLVLGRDQFWLPKWLLSRSVKKEKLTKAVDKLERPAKFVDRFTGPRLTVLTEGAGNVVIVTACILIALVMPLMEVIPFSANFAGAALAAFGLSLIANDGYLAVLAFAFVAGGAILVAFLL